VVESFELNNKQLVLTYIRMIRGNKFLKKLIGLIIFVLAIICVMVTGYLYYHYYYTCPELLEPGVRRIHSLKIHGRIVYLTQQEGACLRWSSCLGVAFFIIGIIYRSYYDPF
jgi:hypothetical protein